MKIALIGYGKMGKEIEQIALQQNIEIAAIIDNEYDWKQKESELEQADVAIEFTQPDVAVDNIKRCFNYGLSVVSGTTGWYARLDEIKTDCMQKKLALFAASNFSIGVAVFAEINRRLAQLMNSFEDYEVSMEEVHHIHKKDAPSGTAITLANDIIANLDRKKTWTIESIADNSQIFIKSIREGNVVGNHSVYYRSYADTIEISHRANNRSGFAKGAILAAKFIKGKQGIFTMKDLLNIH